MTVSVFDWPGWSVPRFQVSTPSVLPMDSSPAAPAVVIRRIPLKRNDNGRLEGIAEMRFF